MGDGPWLEIVKSLRHHFDPPSSLRLNLWIAMPLRVLSQGMLDEDRDRQMGMSRQALQPLRVLHPSFERCQGTLGVFSLGPPARRLAFLRSHRLHTPPLSLVDST